MSILTGHDVSLLPLSYLVQVKLEEELKRREEEIAYRPFKANPIPPSVAQAR